MPRRADVPLMARVALLKSDALQLRTDLAAHGDNELVALLDQVVRDLSTGAALSIINTFGVDHKDVRR